MTKVRHAKSEVFEPFTGDEFEALKESMKKHGFLSQHPITLYKDEVIDGWHRLKAAEELGIKPVFTVFEGTMNEAIDYIFNVNSARRHLSKGQLAQAIMAANTLRGKPFTDSQIARQVPGITKAEISRQRALRKKNPAVADKVAEGKALATAEREANVKSALTVPVSRQRVYILNVTPKQYLQLAEDAMICRGLTPDKYVKQAVSEAIQRDKQSLKEAKRS